MSCVYIFICCGDQPDDSQHWILSYPSECHSGSLWPSSVAYVLVLQNVAAFFLLFYFSPFKKVVVVVQSQSHRTLTPPRHSACSIFSILFSDLWAYSFFLLGIKQKGGRLVVWCKNRMCKREVSIDRKHLFAPHRCHQRQRPQKRQKGRTQCDTPTTQILIHQRKIHENLCI